MYPEEGRNHVFLYHAYALALGGWFTDRRGQLTSLPNLAPSVLPITGGYGAACEKHVNFAVPGFNLYVGHAYSEVRGAVQEDADPYQQYVTTVRSILDNVRINDDLYVEHAEAILQSRHDFPRNSTLAPEAQVFVGESNMSGVQVRGEKVTFKKQGNPDRYARYGDLRDRVDLRRRASAPGTASALTADAESLEAVSWLADLCEWENPGAVPAEAGRYALDVATINQAAANHFRYSLFKDVSVRTGEKTNGIKSAYKSSIDVDNFGRIFLGEVIASHGMKQVNMFRIDLGCDNCGGVGGSSGTTNGGPMP